MGASSSKNAAKAAQVGARKYPTHTSQPQSITNKPPTRLPSDGTHGPQVHPRTTYSNTRDNCTFPLLSLSQSQHRWHRRWGHPLRIVPGEEQTPGQGASLKGSWLTMSYSRQLRRLRSRLLLHAPQPIQYPSASNRTRPTLSHTVPLYIARWNLTNSELHVPKWSRYLNAGADKIESYFVGITVKEED